MSSWLEVIIVQTKELSNEIMEKTVKPIQKNNAQFTVSNTWRPNGMVTKEQHSGRLRKTSKLQDSKQYALKTENIQK